LLKVQDSGNSLRQHQEERDSESTRELCESEVDKIKVTGKAN
jgi:hypothetical protein